jgi:hypothetical protein
VFPVVLIFIISPFLLSAKAGLHPENLFVKEGIDFSQYKKVAHMLDFSKVPNAAGLLNFAEITEQKLMEKGLSVIGFKDYIAYFNTQEFRSSDLYDPEVEQKLMEGLGIDAVIKTRVLDFRMGEKNIDHLHTVTPGQRGFSTASLEPRSAAVFDIILVFEMVDMSKGRKVWSCSISADQKKFEGKPDKYIGFVIDKCLKTIFKSEEGEQR